jgi:predicted peptidase
MGVQADNMKTESTSYRTVTEIQDWGPAITKIILDLGRQVPADSVTTDTFSVYVTRNDYRLKKALVEKGARKITKAYVSDKDGNPGAQSSQYVVLEMTIGPNISLGSPMNYDSSKGLNDWNECIYKITQKTDIPTPAGNISGLIIDTFAGGVKKLVDDFSTGKATFDGITLTYAGYTPLKDNKANPLIVWLHGAGEGGTDTTIPISANKAVNFASEKIQSYFDGAYVLVPQTPTFWMDGFTGSGDGTSKYETALMDLIKNYVSTNSDIDPNRVYIGGDSNGGYMTMVMIRDYPEYFAAAFPTCEALKDSLISDDDIQRMKNVPIWLIAAKTDTTVPVNKYATPTFNRLVSAGAKDVHFSLFKNVVDTSGLYKKSKTAPYEYNGHFSWIYVYNNEVSEVINGQTVTLMEWLASKSLSK